MRALHPLRVAGLVALCVLTAGLPGGTGTARAEESTNARTPAEVFERKPTIAGCIEYVATDLKTRFQAQPEGRREPASLLLVIDPTTSLSNEIEALRQSLPKAWAAGPKGLQIGVYGIDADEFAAPDRLPRAADGSLSALTFLPVNGPKNLHAGIRDAARRLAGLRGKGPRAILLITQEAGESSDRVEKTRDALFDAEVAFYCIAGEAAFERCWVQTYEERRALVNSGLVERYHPEPRRAREGEVFYSGETAFGLVPYKWEFNLAQSEFYWVKPPLYPVPSGFGYWPLATLCYTTGGRYFIFDFPAKGLSKRQNNRRMSLYEYSRMALVAPDLRPRARVLKSLSRDWRARTIIRVWQHLADEKTPIIQTLATLESRGASLVMRPGRPVRSTVSPRAWYEDLAQVADAKGLMKQRVAAVGKALGWWRSANAKERTAKPGASAISERIEADFQLLGINLLKVRFQLHEALAALDTIKRLDVTYRQVRILPYTLMNGLRLPRKAVNLGDDDRNQRFAEVVLAQQRIANKYSGTPWALSLQKGNLKSFRKDVRIIEQTPERPTRPDPKDGKGEPKSPKPPTPPRPRPNPANGPRPGSGSGGPVTGG